MRVPSVELGDEAVFGPDAVALLAQDEVVAVRARQAFGIEEREEGLLELGSGDARREAGVFEDASDRGGPWSAGVAREEGIEGNQVESVLTV